MLSDRIDQQWIQAFEHVFTLCKAHAGEQAIILSETHSRSLNVHLAELALMQMGVPFFHLQLPSITQRTTSPDHSLPIIRSSGATHVLDQQVAAVNALCDADFIVDVTVEGLMHAKQTGTLLKSGARIMNISNEHPEVLARLLPQPNMKPQVQQAIAKCRAAKHMQVNSEAGTELSVDMQGSPTVGVWGWTDRAGTLAHWPGGMVVSFPKPNSISGQLCFQPGDMNLTFKRYFSSEVIFTLENDYVTEISGKGEDAALVRHYLKSFNDPVAYSTSHVGWGMNPQARYEALTMYDQRDLNGTELRAVAGNFLYSTGANEFAGRFTQGHFDLPMMNCTISLDGEIVVDAGTVCSLD